MAACHPNPSSWPPASSCSEIAPFDAVRAVGDPDDAELVGALARAISAIALQAARDGLGEGPDALHLPAAREELVQAVAQVVAPQTRGLGDWLGKQVMAFGLARATPLRTRAPHAALCRPSAAKIERLAVQPDQYPADPCRAAGGSRFQQQTTSVL